MSSPDLARHYKSSSPLPAVNLQPHSPPAEGKKHQAVQELSSNYSCQTGNKYSKQVGPLFLLSPSLVLPNTESQKAGFCPRPCTLV
uniref:Protocadherin domain-containing protein n=1 Tax=Nothobranchius furzeri TaxID=105023 RepID=A0A8C6PZC1_NOTFU